MTVQSPKNTISKWLTTSNIFNLLFAIVIMLLIFNPPAKALLIRSLMKIGLFQPNISSTDCRTALPAGVSFRNTTGNIVDLSTLKGKVVFINFWATWCPPCIAELPSLNALHKQLANNTAIVFLFIDSDNDLPKSTAFIKKYGYDLPLYVANDTIPGNLTGNVIPTTVVIDKLGKIVFKHEGAADYTNIKFVNFLKN